jgi:hypothetical protein
MTDYKDIIAVSNFLSGFRKSWFFAGGWALDLYLNNKTRAHKDIDIAIFRRDQFYLQEYMKDWVIKKVIPRSNGGYMEDWNEGEYLEHPVHELHAFGEGRRPKTMEFLLEEASEKEWIFRRNPDIVMLLSEISLASKEGMNFLKPEIVLLYLATDKSLRSQKIILETFKLLNAKAKDWLSSAIEICRPGHSWLVNLMNPIVKE